MRFELEELITIQYNKLGGAKWILNEVKMNLA